MNLTTNSSIFCTEKYKNFVQENTAILDNIDHGKYESDMLGWVNTNTVTPEIPTIESIAKEIRNEAELFLLIGVGGSNQGARALIDATRHIRKGAPKILYAALNLSADYLQRIIDAMQGKSVYVNIIAKNFKTLEPGITFRAIRQYMENRYGKKESARRIIATGTINDGELHRLANEKGYRFLSFPKDIGGRYSVFSPVGLLPAAVAGCDVHAFLQGAASASNAHEATRDYALKRCFLYNQGFTIEAMAVFEPALESFGRWWRQLFGESEGKDGKGIFPTVFSYTEDLHSIGQYIQQGKKQVTETFIHIKKPLHDIEILPDHTTTDGFEYLSGKTFSQLNATAFAATVEAHEAGGVPCFVFNIEELSEYTLGMMMYSFMKACWYSCTIFGVNPFDQPGVELYKENMQRELRKA